VKRFETFMNTNPYAVKHASEVLHSSASMALFRAFGHMILNNLLQQKRVPMQKVSPTPVLFNF
jgi:hypothetical protein